MQRLIIHRYLRVETHMRASHVYHAARQHFTCFHAEIRYDVSVFRQILVTKRGQQLPQNL